MRTCWRILFIILVLVWSITFLELLDAPNLFASPKVNRPTVNVPGPSISLEGTEVIKVRDPGYGGRGVSFEDVLKKISKNAATLVVPPGLYNVSSHLTVPSNINLRIEKGAVLHIVNGVTLTINGTIEAGPYQIFSWTGTGRVLFGPGAAMEFPLRWWGAKGDGATEDTAAIQKAINAFANPSDYTTCRSVTLCGTYGDTYKVTSLLWQYPAGGGEYARGWVTRFLGNGAKIRQTGVGTYLIKIANSQTNFKMSGWRLDGAVRNAWSTHLASKPATVTFDTGSGPSAGTKVGNKELIFNDKDWFWDNTGGGTLYIGFIPKTSAYNDDPDMWYTSGIFADTTRVKGWTRYFVPGSRAINCSGGGYIDISDIWINDFDIALLLEGCEYSTFSHFNTRFTNTAIKGIWGRWGNNNCSRFRDWYIAGSYGDDSIHWESGNQTEFTGIIQEGTKGRFAYVGQNKPVSGPIAVSFNSCRMEAVGTINHNATVTEMIKLQNTCGISFYNNSLWAGGDNQTYVPGARLPFTSSVKYVFNFIAVNGVLINGGEIYVPNGTANGGTVGAKKVFFYTADAASSGITVRNSWTAISNTTDSAYAIVLWDNPALKVNTTVCLETSLLKASAVTVPEYCLNPYMVKLEPNAKQINAIGTLDSQGYDDKSSLKITWTGTNNSWYKGGLFKNPSGTYCPILSFMYKSDTNQTITAIVNNGPAGTFYVVGDGKWRRVYIMGNIVSVKVDSLRLYSDVGAGNLWVDNISLKCFPTKAEACAWVGCLDVVSGKR